MNKVTSVEAAINRITDGMTIMLGGFATIGTPETLVDGIVAKGIKALTVVCLDAGVAGKGAGKLINAKMIKKYITSHVGLNPEFSRQMLSDPLELELVPQGTLAERIRAGGAGIGGFLTLTGVGTLVEEGKQKVTIKGTDYLLELPLNGDVALVKAHRADRAGNLVFRKSARNFNPLMATACDYVLVEAEQIEDIGAIDPDQVMLPGIFVDAIVQG
jgi:acetate CoA/acetoacetate CoA-transferase alpha subunit